MLTIAKLFGKSPFAPLQTHMNKVASCIEQLPKLFKAVEKKDGKAIIRINKLISKLEHEADLTKNDIRNHLPKSIFLPINRWDLLEILSLQDSFADKAEDIGILLSLKDLENFEDFKDDFTTFYEKNIEAFSVARGITREMTALLETSFGGMEAEKVKGMIEQVAYLEYEVDRMGYNLLKKLYDTSEEMQYSSFHLWLTVLKEIGAISDLSENLGNRIRMMLELK